MVPRDETLTSPLQGTVSQQWQGERGLEGLVRLEEGHARKEKGRRPHPSPLLRIAKLRKLYPRA